ncbi:hypothetical protein ACFQ14_07705 [Pseudahrensia aquimaris]|uniref:Uncharacterized protein n=1 Tax=Pseudahrensia aquimaris TaxID=744461 RepID=A0ABW3FHJ0_9HYPH
MIFPADCAHIILGFSAAMSVRNAFSIPRQDTISAEFTLHEGAPGQSTLLSDWFAERTRWQNANFSNAPEIGSRAPAHEFEILTNVERLKTAETIVLWLDRFLDTQIVACFVASLVETGQLAATQVYQIQYGSIAGHNVSIPTLRERELLSYKTTLEHVSLELSQRRGEFWQRYVAAQNAEQLAHLIKHPNISTVADLAIHSLMKRFPSASNGLTQWDTELLISALNHQPNTARIMAHMLGDFVFNQPDQRNDLILHHRMMQMSDHLKGPPVFEFVGDPAAIRSHTTHCLPLAEEILSGKKNYLQVRNDYPEIANVRMSKDNIFFREEFDKL